MREEAIRRQEEIAQLNSDDARRYEGAIRASNQQPDVEDAEWQDVEPRAIEHIS